MTIGRIPSVEGGIQPTIVDAKGDLIAGVAADSINRLAVGSNDQVLVADSSASTGLAWKSVATPFAAGKNKVINGDFSINQRNLTSTTNGGYGFDRWTCTNVGGTTTMSAQTFTPGTAPVAGYEAANFVRIATTGQTTQSQYTYFEQRIEDVRTFAGQTVTLSFWAKASSGTPYLWLEYSQNFGSGGSGNVDGQWGSTQTLSTSWTRYTVTATIPSISGKTIGTSSFFRVFFWTSVGSSVRGYANATFQNATIDIWGVQVEAGPVATPFQTATGTLQGELAACQRYYYRQAPSGTYSNFGWGNAETTGQVNVQLYLPVTMRTAPTTLDTSAMNTFLYQTGGTSGTTPTTITMNANQTTANLALLQMSKTTSFTVGAMYLLGANNTSSAYLGVSAEL